MQRNGIFLFIGILLLSSCSCTSEFSIRKRLHRPGFYIEMKRAKDKANLDETIESELIPSTYGQHEANTASKAKFISSRAITLVDQHYGLPLVYSTIQTSESGVIILKLEDQNEVHSVIENNVIKVSDKSPLIDGWLRSALAYFGLALLVFVFGFWALVSGAVGAALWIFIVAGLIFGFSIFAFLKWLEVF